MGTENLIQIQLVNRQAVLNFARWFKKVGFDEFSKSEFNKLNSKNTDTYITCLSEDEKMNWGHYFEME